MKAFTIYQPWATLIMIGAKPLEFRPWDYTQMAMYREIAGTRIVVHAGARKVKAIEIVDLLERLESGTTGLVPDKARPLLEKLRDAHSSSTPLPLGAGLGTATILRPRRALDLFKGQVADSDRIDKHLYAWPLQAIEPFPEPLPCRGQQGFWDFPKDLYPTAWDAPRK